MAFDVARRLRGLGPERHAAAFSAKDIDEYDSAYSAAGMAAPQTLRVEK
ncbi:MAG TPA: hypothetical protein VGJ20_04930 [Xanthobacteraceae bacterium]|jgi:hypothetical protein